MGRNSTLRITHTFASPAHQVHGIVTVISGDTPHPDDDTFRLLQSPIVPVQHLGEVGIWNVCLRDNKLKCNGDSFHAFPARKGVHSRYAQAAALANVIERDDSIEADEDWIRYLEKYASDDSELLAGWAGRVLSERGLSDKSLQPFLLALCSNGRHVTSQVPIDWTLSHSFVLGDKWLSSAAQFAMVKRWFASPVSDVEVVLLADAMHGLEAKRARSGISKDS